MIYVRLGETDWTKVTQSALPWEKEGRLEPGFISGHFNVTLYSCTLRSAEILPKHLSERLSPDKVIFEA